MSGRGGSSRGKRGRHNASEAKAQPSEEREREADSEGAGPSSDPQRKMKLNRKSNAEGTLPPVLEQECRLLKLQAKVASMSLMLKESERQKEIYEQHLKNEKLKVTELNSQLQHQARRYEEQLRLLGIETQRLRDSLRLELAEEQKAETFSVATFLARKEAEHRKEKNKEPGKLHKFTWPTSRGAEGAYSVATFLASKEEG